MRNHRITESQNHRITESPNHSVIQLFGDSVIRKSRQAFTLIEIMVATMLLAMLVTILTMIFNQSSIAWTTGVASVTALSDTREEMSVRAIEAEDAILSDDGNTVLRVASVWADNGSGLRAEGRTLRNDFERNIPQSNLRDPMNDNTITISGGNVAQHESYLVGVHSYGPDGKTGGDNSWDDISTMPEEIVK